MARIPLVVVEEHHEAFVEWCTRLERSGTVRTLVHVDHHSDLGVPTCRVSCDELNMASRRDVVDFAHTELHAGNFIVPAVYAGLFQTIIWLDQDGPADDDLRPQPGPLSIISPSVVKERGEVSAYVRSRGQLGMELLVGEYCEGVDAINDSTRVRFTVKYARDDQSLIASTLARPFGVRSAKHSFFLSA